MIVLSFYCCVDVGKEKYKNVCSFNCTITDLHFTSKKLQHFLQRLNIQDVILGIHAAIWIVMYC